MIVNGEGQPLAANNGNDTTRVGVNAVISFLDDPNGALLAPSIGSAFTVVVPGQRFKIILTGIFTQLGVGSLAPHVTFVQADGMAPRQVRLYALNTNENGFEIEIQDLTGAPATGDMIFIFYGVLFVG